MKKMKISHRVDDMYGEHVTVSMDGKPNITIWEDGTITCEENLRWY